jgi:two-component sensor histidine kinase
MVMSDTKNLVADASPTAQAMIDGLRQRILILDDKLRVVATSRAFSAAFGGSAKSNLNKAIAEIGNGEWRDSNLQSRLMAVIADDKDMVEHEIEREFPSVGQRTLLVSASRLIFSDNYDKRVLLQIEDVTDRRSLDREKDELLKRKDVLIEEMSHRVSNSLQIIASILMLKARSVGSPEARRHLDDARHRVLAIASVQGHLRVRTAAGDIGARSYLTGLCESLSQSLLNEDLAVSIAVDAGEGAFTTDQAVSVGLITTELVINAIKHAFPDGASGNIVVRHESGVGAWRLSVSDDGIGITRALNDPPLHVGLGTSILEALTRQLGGHLVTSPNAPGTTVSLTVPQL